MKETTREKSSVARIRVLSGAGELQEPIKVTAHIVGSGNLEWQIHREGEALIVNMSAGSWVKLEGGSSDKVSVDVC